MFIKNLSQKHPYLFGSASLWLLLFSNSVTIFFAVKDDWSLLTIGWIYWFQSIIIGFFNFIRILQLKEFSTTGFTINNQPTKPTQSTKITTAFFFLAHYGFFHFVYLIFLLIGFHNFDAIGGVKIYVVDIKSIFLIALLFFINHFFSYIYNKPRDTKKQNIGTLMFYPYARIIPMQFTIGIGAFLGQAILPFFLILKTFADVVMHTVEHQIIRKGEE